MAIDTTPLLRLANTMQATNLVGHNLKTLKKKNITTKDIVKSGVTNVVGVSFVKETAKLI